MILTDQLTLAQYIGRESGVPLEVARAIIAKVKADRQNKNIDVVKHWDMYQGNHSNYFKQRKDEDNELFNHRKKNAIVSNYVRYVVDLSAKFLYGRASKVSRVFSDSKTTDERMRRLLRYIHYDLLMLDAKKRAGAFGEIGFRLIPIDYRTGQQPENGVASEQTYPHPIILDPTKTFFLVNKWGKIIAVVIEDEYVDYSGGLNLKHKTLELLVGDSRWFWDDHEGIGFNSNRLVSAVKNLYGLNEEFVLAKNNDNWTDEVQDILGLNVLMDEVLTDNANFFARHGWPQLVSSIDLKGVQHSPNHVWTVESDGPGDDIEKKLMFLQWDGRMQEANEFVQYIEALIFKISSTARIATGDLEAIGQLRSGPAIVTAHSPSIMKTQELQVVWCHNEYNLLLALAGFDSKIHGQDVESRYPELDVYINFPRDFVPGEELVRAEVQTMQTNAHIRTFSDLIRENHPEFSETEVEEYRAELMKDSRDVVDSEREFISTQTGGTGKSGQSGSSQKKATEQT